MALPTSALCGDSQSIMALTAYHDIIELFQQGATAEAEARFLALRQSRQAARPEATLPPGILSEIEARPEWDGNAYFLVENGRKIGPFCQRCYAQQGRLVKLQAQDCITYRCCACQTEHARKLCG